MLPSIRTCAAAEPVSGALTSRRAVDDGWNRSGGVVRSAPDRRLRTASTAGPAATNRPSMLGTRPESINSRTSRTSTPAAVAISAALNTSSRCETSGMRTLLRAKALPCRRVPSRRIGPGLRPILSPSCRVASPGCAPAQTARRMEGTLSCYGAGTRDSGSGDQGPRRRPFSEDGGDVREWGLRTRDRDQGNSARGVSQQSGGSTDFRNSPSDRGSRVTGSGSGRGSGARRPGAASATSSRQGPLGLSPGPCSRSPVPEKPQCRWRRRLCYNPLMSMAQTVIVTGASSGIGRSATMKFAAAGAAVLAVGRNERRSTRWSRTARHAGGRAGVRRNDITAPEAPDRIVAALPRGFRIVDDARQRRGDHRQRNRRDHDGRAVGHR